MLPVVRQTAIGLMKLLCAVTFTMFVCGWMFNALEWLRNFGMPPVASSLAAAPIVSHRGMLPPLLRPMAEAIAIYNATFPGYGRFGSGLGIIISAIGCHVWCSRYTTAARLLLAAACGFVAGARALMMLTSDVVPVICAGVVGAAIFVVHVLSSLRPCRFQPLPRLPLHSP